MIDGGYDTVRVEITITRPHSTVIYQYKGEIFTLQKLVGIMEETGDIVHRVESLVDNISSKLDGTFSSIRQVEEQLRNFVPEEKLQEFIDLSKKYEDNDDINNQRHDEEQLLIQRLEAQRMNLVMDIQREDYIRNKLTELIEHNDEMISSVKDYLTNRQTIVNQDYQKVNDKVNHYLQEFIKPSLKNLNTNNRELNQSIHNVEIMINHLLSEFNQKLLNSKEYNERVNEVIYKLNDVFKKWHI